jgi:hypothetical protein
MMLSVIEGSRKGPHNLLLVVVQVGAHEMFIGVSLLGGGNAMSLMSYARVAH